MPSLNRRSALFALGAAALPAPAFAADPWEKEPAQWTEKDMQKILTDSPWSKTVSVAMGGPSVGNIGGGGRGGRGGRSSGGGGMPDASSSSSMGGSPMGGEGGGMGGGGGMAPSLNFLIRWQTAKPIKIASVRSRMGAEAETSPQAKAFVERQEEEYVIAVVMPGMRAPGEGRPGAGPQGDRKAPPEDAAEKMKATTWLSWKGHEQVHPTSITMPRPGQNAFIFHFSKQHPIELADKEVEFAMHRGNLEIKKKFKLKDMLYQGQLAL